MKNRYTLYTLEPVKEKKRVFLFNPDPLVLRSTFTNSLNYQNIAIAFLTGTQ